MNRSALDALALEEKGALLDELLLTHPDLVTTAESLAVRRLEVADRTVIAERVATALKSLDQELLSERAGYHPGRGYVHETQAAADLLGEALQPFYDDIERRATLGVTGATVEIGFGILLGLYDCHGYYEDGSLFTYAEEFPADEAHWVVQRLRKLGIELPGHELECSMPAWELS